MPIDANGNWYPDLFDKQIEVFNCPKRAVLLSGPRKTGKTIAALHRLVRHLWETPRGRAAMFSRTIKNSKDGGPWMKLHRDIIPEWIEVDIGFKYTTTDSDGRPGPKVDGQTRTMYFRVRNMHGGESECMLFSLDYDHDVEAKIKEMEFSMIYFSELSKFGIRDVLSVSLLSLRMKNLRFDQQQWLADTNPSDEGDASWIYRVWYQERIWTYAEYRRHNEEQNLPVLPEPAFLDFQNSLELFDWGIKDNPRLDPREVTEIIAACSYDPGLYARLVEGKWVFGDGDKSRHFRGFFVPNIHVVGDCSSPDEEEWEGAIPSPNSYRLCTGWDLGDTNHAAVLIDPVVSEGRLCFVVLDELVSINEGVSIDDFTERFMEILEAHEKREGKVYDLDNWADSSNLYKAQGTSGTYPHAVVRDASGGRFNLVGVDKPSGSVSMRVTIMKRLLRQFRIQISAHCKMTIQMLQNLKKGRTTLSYVVQDENKHVFDALTYALMEETKLEMETKTYSNVGQRGGLSVSIS